MVLIFSDKWTFRTIEHLFGFDVHLKLVRMKYVKKRSSFDDTYYVYYEMVGKLGQF